MCTYGKIEGTYLKTGWTRKDTEASDLFWLGYLDFPFPLPLFFLRGISETISLAYLQAYGVSFQSHRKMSAGPWKASQTSLLPVAPRDRDIHHKSHFWKLYPATNSIVFLLLHRVPLPQSQMAPKPEKSHPQYPFKNYKEPKTKKQT